MHQSVVEISKKMLFEMKRHNYVTPTNYLELVIGYRTYVICYRFIFYSCYFFVDKFTVPQQCMCDTVTSTLALK